MGAGLLRYGKEAGEVRRVGREPRQAEDRAVGQRGDGGLQMQHPGERYGDDAGAQRLEGGPQLAYALLVGASAETHMHGPAALQDVPAVERAGSLDATDRVPEGAYRLLDRRRLCAPGGRGGAADERGGAEDDDGVLHEHAVGAVLLGRNLDRLPAAVPQHPYVLRPLAYGEVPVHRHPVDMGDQAVGETCGGRPYEGLAFLGHGLTPSLVIGTSRHGDGLDRRALSRG
ncbi:hypothetical protein AN218_06080 [Streptomyces nanshensis]|uniref:Uncharacterized protein n=1 Tax=Streptomyces nanshensis TaxID=518642 RepID=A0A1E7LAD2_9ACTN|nr:hypothetical protein AN218_06080 [Streptomyces nanshensis]